MHPVIKYFTNLENYVGRMHHHVARIIIRLFSAGEWDTLHALQFVLFTKFSRLNFDLLNFSLN